MGKVILYNNQQGILVVLYPTPEAISMLGIDNIAQKDVPAGFPYAIVDGDGIPNDRTFRSAWDVEQSTLTDGIGAEYGAGTPWGVVEYGNGFVIVEHEETKEQKELTL